MLGEIKTARAIRPVPARAREPKRYRYEFAVLPSDIQAVQRLRYEVFAMEGGASLETPVPGLDVDRFDPHCLHLLVRDQYDRRVVASTRLLTDDQAIGAGGFYSEQEFWMDPVLALPGRCVEIGRTCVRPEYRKGAVISTLWSGIASFVSQNGFRYLFGSASISLQDGGATAWSIMQRLQRSYWAGEALRVSPKIALPMLLTPPEHVVWPPLLKAYVSLGALACGEPYWDADFDVADVFMLLDMGDLAPRYARRFLRQ